LREACIRAGYYPEGAPVSDEEIYEFSLPFWEMVRTDEVFRYTPEYASEVARRFLLDRASHGDAVKWANMPARWVVLQRINLGLIALLGRLCAQANWRRIAEEMWPLTDRPPTTPLGHEEAAWWAAHSERPAPRRWAVEGFVSPGETDPSTTAGNGDPAGRDRLE